MALTGHSHRPGKITATTHLPCPLAYARGSFLPRQAGRPRRPPARPDEAQNWPLCASPAKRAPGSPPAPSRRSVSTVRIAAVTLCYCPAGLTGLAVLQAPASSS